MDSIMNKLALDEVLANLEDFLEGCTGVSEEWRLGFTAVVQLVERHGWQIVEACEAEYGDAEGPLMNQDALTALWAWCDGMYNDSARTGNNGEGWLLGVSAGIQRLEMYAGDIVADCT